MSRLPGVSTAPSSVLYPSKRKPLNPAKAATNQAIQKLRSKGIEVAQLSCGYPYIFGLAKYHPELLKEVLGSIDKRNTYQNLVWKEILSYSYFTVPSSEILERDVPTHFQIVPVASEVINKKRHTSARSSIRTVTNNVYGVLRLRPDITLDARTLCLASELYFDIKVDNIINSKTHNDRRHVHAHNVDDIIFIAEHLEAVKELVPELNKRKARDRDVIAALLEAGTKPLLDGVL